MLIHLGFVSHILPFWACLRVASPSKDLSSGLVRTLL
jgi:hypothetical protein